MTALHSFRAYSELALAMLMLFSCFTIPALPGVRAGLRAALGQTRYLVAHSAVAGDVCRSVQLPHARRTCRPAVWERGAGEPLPGAERAGGE